MDISKYTQKSQEAILKAQDLAVGVRDFHQAPTPRSHHRSCKMM